MNSAIRMSVLFCAFALVTLTLLLPAPAMAQRADDTPTARYVMQIPSLSGNQRIEIHGFSHEILSPRDSAQGRASTHLSR
jgi:hypothetical protein